MKKSAPSLLAALALAILVSACASSGTSTPGKKVDVGKMLFEQHCAICHPDGRNLIRPEKTLVRERLEKVGLSTTGALVTLMRHPGPGMKTFPPETLTNEEVTAIARYVLETF